MTDIAQSLECSGCNEPLPLNHPGPCPKCGDERKTHKLNIHETVNVRASLSWQHVQEYWEHHPVFLTVALILTFGSPFLGLVLAGWVGVGVGLVVAAASFFLGLRGVTKVRQIKEGP